MPESTQLSSTSKPLHVRVPLPAPSPKRHQTVRRKAPPTVASPSWTRRPELRERKQASGARGFSVQWAEGGAGRRTSAYLRRVPQRCRRHRTSRRGGAAELERRRDARAAVSLPGLARGTPGGAEPRARLCAAETAPPLGPPQPHHLRPSLAFWTGHKLGAVNGRLEAELGGPAPTLCAQTETPCS